MVKNLGEIYVPIPGVHMVHNALMAAAAMYHVHGSVPLPAFAQSGRVGRRFTEHAAPNNIRVIEDYAHHQRDSCHLGRGVPRRGVFTHIFQPHRYTRTRDLLNDFASCFDQAEAVVIVPTYARRGATGRGRWRWPCGCGCTASVMSFVPDPIFPTMECSRCIYRCKCSSRRHHPGAWCR